MMAFASMVLLAMPLGNVTAEQVPGTAFNLLGEQNLYKGEINSISAEQGLVVIDDRSFILDRVIRFNNATWSREQVLNRLQPGDLVEIKTGRVVDMSRGAKLITELRVLD